jgi:hypothetical protein
VADGDTDGFRELAVKPKGPVQENMVIPAAPPERVSGLPAQTGLLEAAVDTGSAFTTTVVVAAALVHPLALVTLRL